MYELKLRATTYIRIEEMQTLLVELQRCVKNSMAAKVGWRNEGKFEGTCKQ